MYDILKFIKAINGFEVCGKRTMNCSNVYSEDDFYSSSKETVKFLIICSYQKNKSISRSSSRPNFSMSRLNCSTSQSSFSKNHFINHLGHLALTDGFKSLSEISFHEITRNPNKTFSEKSCKGITKVKKENARKKMEAITKRKTRVSKMVKCKRRI